MIVTCRSRCRIRNQRRIRNRCRDNAVPTDAEWSLAAGLSESTDEAPSNKRGKIGGLFPWGTQWPPFGLGNYASVLNVDSYDYTSPVGSFAANPYGLYDMGGNVWQWCEDWFNADRQHHVVRGASWRTGNSQLMLSSWRDATYDCTNIIGFRCVLGTESPIQ